MIFFKFLPSGILSYIDPIVEELLHWSHENPAHCKLVQGHFGQAFTVQRVNHKGSIGTEMVHHEASSPRMCIARFSSALG